MASGGEKKTGLYENWLKHFAINVMTQSFHAFFLMFVMKMLSELSKIGAADVTKLTANDGLVAIMSVVGMMAIIKFEKLFKDLFGMKDSMAGSLKASGAEVFAGIKSAGTFGKEIKAPFDNASKSRRNMSSLGKNLQKDFGDKSGLADNRLGHYIKPSETPTGTSGAAGTSSSRTSAASPFSDKTQELYNKMKEAKKTGDMDSYKDYRDHAATQMKYERVSAGGNTSTGAGGNTSNSAFGNTGTGGNAGSSGTNSSGRSMDLDKRQQEYNDAVLEHRKNKRKVLAQSAVNMASMTMAMGGTENMAEAIVAANVINNPINMAANRYIDHGENITARESTGDSSRYNERTISDAIKQGFAHATGNSKSNGGTGEVKITLEGAKAAAKSYATLPFTTAKNTLTRSKADNVRVNNVDDL